MKLTNFALLVAVTLMCAGAATAQTDLFGKIDTVYADVAKIDDHTWSVTVSMTNDESVIGLSIPFKLSAGTNRVVGDSAVYTGGRVEHFAYKGFRADTAVQCVTMGLVANMGPTQLELPAGSGRLVTFFVSSLDKKPSPDLKIDTTTTHPSNELMAVANMVQKIGDKVDSIPAERLNEVEIRPAFVVRKAE